MTRLSCSVSPFRLIRPLRLGALVIAILALSGLLSGCGTAPKDDTADPASVTASFTEYASAVNAKNGDLSADLMSASSRAYYDRMRDLALDADQATLTKEKVIDQITVLSMRTELDPKLLRTADARTLVSTSVKQGLISQNSGGGMTLAQIAIKGKVATAQLVQKGAPDATGQQVPVTFQLENDKWRFDVTSLLAPAESAIDQAATMNKMSGTKLVETVMTTRVGATKAKTLWTPLGR